MISLSVFLWGVEGEEEEDRETNLVGVVGTRDSIMRVHRRVLHVR